MTASQAKPSQAELRIPVSISEAELERRWRAVRAMMEVEKLDFLIVQSCADFLGGYVKWFTDMAALHSYPVTVIFPHQDAMTTIWSGPRQPAEPNPPAWSLRGVGKRLSVPIIPALGYSSTFAADAVVTELASHSNCRIGLVGLGFISAAFYKTVTKKLSAATFIDAAEQVDAIKVIKISEEMNLIRQVCRDQDAAFEYAAHGYYAVEAELKLSGWTRARRVVVVRWAVKDALVVEKEAMGKRQKRQQSLHFADPLQPVKLWEYAVLVTNSEYDLEAIGQLYRDRADCENGFDELKNQWGWGGYTTQDLERCNLSARAVALIYNWWSWYVRLAHPKARLEAITSRPLLLAAVARLTQHAGQSRLVLTLTHGAGDQIKAMIANVRKGLDIILASAPQLTKPERWKALVRYIVERIIAARPINQPPPIISPPIS